jgi:chemotaxis-related protein WspB
MLCLLFQLGKGRFAVDATHVVEVLPLVRINPMPHAPNGVAGFFNYRTRIVPVIDLCQLVAGKPAGQHLSTRIILVDFQDATGTKHLAGLIAEQATTTIRKERTEFVEPGISTKDASYLGPVAPDGKDFIQLIDPGQWLAERAKDLLAFLPQGGAP